MTSDHREPRPGPVAPSPRPDPAPPVPEADQAAVILTRADVSTVFAALDIAADYKRDRPEMCTETAEAAPATRHVQTEADQ